MKKRGMFKKKEDKTPEQLRQEALHRNSKRHEKRKRRKRIMLSVLLLSLIAVVAVTLSLTLFFPLQDIVVEGSQLYTKEQILAMTTVQWEDNLFSISLRDMKEDILFSARELDGIHIKRRLPDSLVITLFEAEPAMALKTDDGYLMVSGGGRIMKREFLPPEEELLEVSGFTLIDFEIGSFLTETEDYAVLAKLWRAAEEQGITDITEISFYQDGKIRLLYEDRVSIVLWNLLDLDYKLSFCRQTLEEEIGKTESGILDTAVDGKVYFRPMPLKEQEQELGK